jgi:hypothetical protein
MTTKKYSTIDEFEKIRKLGKGSFGIILDIS